MANKEFTHEEFGLTYSVPENPTAFDVLTYDGRRLDLHGEPSYLIMWECAKTWIRDWKCKKFPNPHVDLSTVQDMEVSKILKLVGLEVTRYRTSLEQVPKNS